MSEFVSHAINMPYGIDLVFWAVFMFLAVLVVTKFPQGIGCLFAFLVSVTGAVTILTHMYFVEGELKKSFDYPEIIVQAAIEKLSAESIQCGKDTTQCSDLDQLKLNVEQALASRQRSQTEKEQQSTAFALVSNLCIFTLGGMSAGFITAVGLRRPKPGEDEAEEADMRAKSREGVIGFCTFLLVMVAAAISAAYLGAYMGSAFSRVLTDASFKSLWIALGLSGFGYLCAYWFYDARPIGKWCMYIIFFITVSVMGFYISALHAGLYIVVREHAWPMLFIAGVPLMYAVWKVSVAVYLRNAERI